MNISVLGCGRWGSFLAWYNNSIGHTVTNYGREDSPSYLKLKNEGKNEWITLDPAINLTSDLSAAVNSADIMIISISSQGLREFLPLVLEAGGQDKPIVLCMKGIEVATGKRLTQVALECGVDKRNIAVWVGPGHIQEFTANRPNCMVIDSYYPEVTSRLISAFKSPLIRFYHGCDIIGTEIGAATKNIMGIIAGVLDGLGLAAMKGALMARGSREVARLIKALGGSELSAYGLCHLGDYETTLFSQHSHNRRFGEMFVLGETFGKLAEGVTTAQAVAKMARDNGVDVPLTDAVCGMLDGRPVQKLIEDLFNRALKPEFE
jgi:glycerol-3-phosphate dehydrogenase (NAD(P)+)